MKPSRPARVSTLAVTGDVDIATADEWIAECRAAAEDCTTFVLDLSGVTFLDSSGIRMLLTVLHDGLDIGRALLVRGPSLRLLDLLKIAGVAELFAFIE